MLRTFKMPGIGEQLEKNGLADILCVGGAFQIGIAQPQDQVGIGIHQPLCLAAVHGSIRIAHFLCCGVEKRFHQEYD